MPRTQWTLILKLRSNIRLESDLQLAEMEIGGLLSPRFTRLSRNGLEGYVAEGTLRSRDLRHSRESGTVAYRVDVDQFDAELLFRRLSFVELVVGTAAFPQCSRAGIVAQLATVPPGFVRLDLDEDKATFRLLPFNTAVEWSDVLVRCTRSSDEAIRAMVELREQVLDCNDPPRSAVPAERAVSAKITTGHLFHGLHIYKAKFFPRMVRAFLNTLGGTDAPYVLDPFVGSGTTLTEASAMGMPSTGVDIDPLSALITRAKIDLVSGFGVDTPDVIDAIRDAVDMQQTGQLPLLSVAEARSPYASLIPPFLEHRIPQDVQSEMIRDISLALSAMAGLSPKVNIIARIVLSDAISRKLKFRFLGLGYGRFALNVATGRIVDSFRHGLDYLAKSVAVWHWLRHEASIHPGPSSVHIGDVRALGIGESACDLIVTSPPYMPASSGRENYLKSKGLAMIALGLVRSEEIEMYERTQVGSVQRVPTPALDLPRKAREVVDWMASDPVRQVKAAATASYFLDILQSLREMRRVLRPGGQCAMVIARQHTFYRYSSREIVRVVDNADIIADLARLSGFDVHDEIHVELVKQNAVARPRSLDAYYETILVLCKPSERGVTEEREAVAVSTL